MRAKALDHVNIRTADVAGMTAWYGDILGLSAGWRPAFPFPGAWLYAGDAPIVHLVEVSAAPSGEDLGLEHFSISAEGLSDFLARLEERGAPHDKIPIEDAGVIQVHLHDPDGNHIHVDFALSEAV